MGAFQILHGPRLKEKRPKPGPDRTAPATWNLTVRMTGLTVDRLERVAKLEGVCRVDIMRTAILSFLDKYELWIANSAVNDQALPASAAPEPVQPALADGYRGNGRSDFAAGQAVNERQATRKREGRQGERLRDTSTSR